MISLNHDEQANHQNVKESDNNAEQTINLLKKQVALAAGMSTIPTPEWREKTGEFINELKSCVSKMIDSNIPTDHDVDNLKELQRKILRLKCAIDF